MKVLIIGAGMGGLTAALGLRRHGFDVEVYERVTENKPVGAAISLWPNGVKALNYLGLGPQVAAIGGQLESMAYRDATTGDTMCEFSLEPVTTASGQRPYPVARAELQRLLIDAYGAADIAMGKQLVAIDQDEDSVTATFADGTTATGDVLIGADGAKAVSRDYVVGQGVSRRYAGYVNWNGLVPIDPAIGPATQWTTYVGEGKRASVMPVADGRFYFFLDVPLPAGLPYSPTQAKSVLAEHFGHWAPGVQALLDAIDPGRLNRVEIYDVEPFHTWVKGRVALLGDAAHNTTPDIGQGGCSAMEDSMVLAMALASNTLGPHDALQRYQQARSARAAELVLKARKRCDVTHAKDPDVTAQWYRELWDEDGTGVIAGIVGNIVGSPIV